MLNLRLWLNFESSADIAPSLPLPLFPPPQLRTRPGLSATPLEASIRSPYSRRGPFEFDVPLDALAQHVAGFC